MIDCVLSNRKPNAGSSKQYVHLTWRKQKVVMHRAIWEVWNGPLPVGMEIDHLCEQPLCINQRHLDAVTHAENDRRRAMRTTHCPRGHEFLGRVLGGEAYTDRRQRRCPPCAREMRGQKRDY